MRAVGYGRSGKFYIFHRGYYSSGRLRYRRVAKTLTYPVMCVYTSCLIGILSWTHVTIFGDRIMSHTEMRPSVMRDMTRDVM